MTRFWCSFWGGDGDDCRPVYTTEKPKFQWWHTGSREEDPPHSICAVIDAESEDDAYAQARVFWPEAEERFCESRPEGWMPDTGRFPTSPEESKEQ